MLFQIGTVALDTRPFTVDAMDRSAAADFAVKPVMGVLPPREFTGEGEDKITLKGQLVPSKLGGLDELEALHEMRRAGQRLPVMRGDGRSLGWWVIEDIREGHETIVQGGVGFTVKHTIALARTSPDGASPTVVSDLLSLFGLLGR